MPRPGRRAAADARRSACPPSASTTWCRCSRPTDLEDALALMRRAGRHLAQVRNVRGRDDGGAVPRGHHRGAGRRDPGRDPPPALTATGRCWRFAGSSRPAYTAAGIVRGAPRQSSRRDRRACPRTEHRARGGVAPARARSAGPEAPGVRAAARAHVLLRPVVDVGAELAGGAQGEVRVAQPLAARHDRVGVAAAAGCPRPDVRCR